ncbi:MAG: hypothetical protein N3B10_11565 [Armatimonadetes bacterium]|nr:hypothetical protein [Armatimonadota bacterium]
MRRSKALIISVWCFVAFAEFGLDRNFASVLLAAPIPPDPSLDVAVTVHGQFVNWETGERKRATILPQVLWALANELPTRTDLLRRAIKNEQQGALLFQPKIWEQWQHRTVQTLKPPKNWLVWDTSDDPLELRFSARDSKKRLTEVKLVTVNEEATLKARNGVAQTVWRIKPTDSAVIILRNKTGVLAFLLVRWTPLIFSERVGIVADAGPVPAKVERCEECQRGEKLALQVFPELPQLEKGFVRVYRRLKVGDLEPDENTELPHFPLKAHAWINLKDLGQGGVYADFVRSIPPLEPKEAVWILCYEARSGTPYELKRFPAGQRMRVRTTHWEFYDIQKRLYVAIAWEVRIRYGALPPFFSSYNEAAYRTQAIAREIVKEIPLSPPNDVAAILVEKLRSQVKEWRIGLMPRATLWFEGNVVKRRVEFYEPPSEGTYQREEWELRQQFVRLLQKGLVPVKFSWTDKRANNGGSLKLKWLRWLKPQKQLPPQRREQNIKLGQLVLVPSDAEYEVETQPPEGFSAVPNFRLTLVAKSEPLSPILSYQVPLEFAASDHQVKVLLTHHQVGNYPDLKTQLVVGVEIPVTLVYLWELRVAFNRTPVKGELTIILEGNRKRWEQKAIASLTGAWDIPPHTRWLFPDLRRPGEFIARDAAIFRLIPPGRYTLRVEGTIGGEASVDVSTFPNEKKIITMREPVRQIRWRKRIEVKAGSVETVVVPLPR